MDGLFSWVVISAVIAFRCLLVFLTLLFFACGLLMGDSTGHDGGRARALHSTSNGVGAGRSVGQGLRGRYGIVVCLAFFLSVFAC
jgi:hypothetical protein